MKGARGWISVCLIVVGFAYTASADEAVADASDADATTTPAVDGGLDPQLPCTVRGYVTWNGSAVGAGELVEGKRANDANYTTSDETDSTGFYSLSVANANGHDISIRARGQTIGLCPTTCPSSNPVIIDCNVQAGGTCSNPSATLALLLPPALFGPAALRRRRAASRRS